MSTRSYSPHVAATARAATSRRLLIWSERAAAADESRGLATRVHAPAPRLRCGTSRMSNSCCVVMRSMPLSPIRAIRDLLLT
jgi:hypothetical protein